MHLIARYHDGEQTDPRGLAICLAAFCVGITFLTAAL